MSERPAREIGPGAVVPTGAAEQREQMMYERTPMTVYGMKDKNGDDEVVSVVQIRSKAGDFSVQVNRRDDTDELEIVLYASQLSDEQTKQIVVVDAYGADRRLEGWDDAR